MDLALLIVELEVLSVPSSWHQTSVRSLELVCSRPYYPFDDVRSFPIRPRTPALVFFVLELIFLRTRSPSLNLFSLTFELKYLSDHRLYEAILRAARLHLSSSKSSSYCLSTKLSS